MWHKNQVAVVFRNFVKLDDWGAKINEIKNMQSEVESRIQKYQKVKEQSDQEWRQKEEDYKKRIHSLGVPDPDDDIEAILRAKGTLFPECCQWVLEGPDFRAWLEGPDKRVLRITGDPGKGKTMLMCSIIRHLQESLGQKNGDLQVFYYFCQASKSESTTYSTLALRSLIRSIVKQRRDLACHIPEPSADNQSTNNNTPFIAQRTLKSILTDSSLDNAIICVDALDECGKDVLELLELLQQLNDKSTIKWMVSTRGSTALPCEELFEAPDCVSLSLEHEDKLVSDAVHVYIEKQIATLTNGKVFPQETKKKVRTVLEERCEGTFLWVSLVCKELRGIRSRFDVANALDSFPAGLGPLYSRMMAKIEESSGSTRCKSVLGVSLLLKGPITPAEFRILVNSTGETAYLEDLEHLEDVVAQCQSFLRISDTVNFVHKSAKDYLQKFFDNSESEVFLGEINQNIFKKCMKLMETNLRRDMWGLVHPGEPKPHSKPNPDPLLPVTYACIFWVDHLDLDQPNFDNLPRLERSIREFLEVHLLHWVEALSLLDAFSQGIHALEKLQIFSVCSYSYIINDKANWGG